MKTRSGAAVASVVALAAALAWWATASAKSTGRSTELAVDGMPRLAGQQQTCNGPRQKTFALEAHETSVDLGRGMHAQAWTFDNHLPGPTIEACEGDEVTITMTNRAHAPHGLDSHSLQMDSSQFGPVGPNATMTLHRVVTTPGVFMYHCAAGVNTDLHIKSGMAGAMIVYARAETLRPARELVIVQSALYGESNGSGLIGAADPGRTMKNDPSYMLFNGRLQHDEIPVLPGDLVRVYYVNVGPGVASTHVMGTVLDRVTDGTRRVEGVQTYGVPAGSGAIIEFRIPESGMFGFVDHDRLAYIQQGLVVPFMASADAPAHAAHSGM